MSFRTDYGIAGFQVDGLKMSFLPSMNNEFGQQINPFAYLDMIYDLTGYVV